MYKTETHLHTAESSYCGKLKAEEMINIYAEAGYSTVFVSDHFHHMFFDRLGDISWEEKMAIFLAGYYRAKVVGDRIGVNVLMSAEFTFRNSPNDYLAYGFDKEFLYEHPEIPDLTPEEFSALAKQNNIFLVQAHPLRDRFCYATPELVDAFEVSNSNPRHENYDEECSKIAKDNNLFVTAGSDAHRIEDVAKSGIITEREIKTAQDYIEVVKSGNLEFIKRKGCNQ